MLAAVLHFCINSGWDSLSLSEATGFKEVTIYYLTILQFIIAYVLLIYSQGVDP